MSDNDICLDCWTQAILISQLMGRTQLSKTLTKYAGKAGFTDPFFTLILVNNGMGQKVLEANPAISATWPKHIAYLLQNSAICDEKYLADFLVSLSKVVKNTISYSAGFFVKLVAGNPIPDLSELWMNLGKNLRTVLLAEIVQGLWNSTSPTMEASKAAIINIYYEKALILYNLGHLSHVSLSS